MGINSVSYVRKRTELYHVPGHVRCGQRRMSEFNLSFGDNKLMVNSVVTVNCKPKEVLHPHNLS